MDEYTFVYEAEWGIASVSVEADNILDAQRKAGAIDSDAIDCLIEIQVNGQ